MAPKHPQFPTDCLSPRWYRCRVPLVLNTRHWNEPPLSLLRKLVLFPELFRDPGICPSPNPVTSYTQHRCFPRIWAALLVEQGVVRAWQCSYAARVLRKAVSRSLLPFPCASYLNYVPVMTQCQHESFIFHHPCSKIRPSIKHPVPLAARCFHQHRVLVILTAVFSSHTPSRSPYLPPITCSASCLSETKASQHVWRDYLPITISPVLCHSHEE